MSLLFRSQNTKYLASKLLNITMLNLTSTDQRWDSVEKTHNEPSQGKQFLKSNGIAEVSGMQEEHLTVGRCCEREIILNALTRDDQPQMS